MILRTEIGGFMPSVVTDGDKIFSKDLLPVLSVTAGDVDLQQWCTEVSNQLWESSCVANASADAIELCNGLDGLTQVQISRNQIYYNGRSIMTVDGIHNLTNLDKGMSVKAAFQAMNVFGICPESLWPYTPDKVNVRPDIKATWYALNNKLHSYYRIDSIADGMLSDIQSAIGGRHPVCFGIPVTEAFYKASGNQVIPPPQGEPWNITEKVIGQHCIMAMGKIGNNIKIRNSWGTDWGDGGYALLDPGWFVSGFANDPWVPTNGLVFQGDLAS